jgi:hypothetical protein
MVIEDLDLPNPVIRSHNPRNGSSESPILR